MDEFDGIRMDSLEGEVLITPSMLAQKTIKQLRDIEAAFMYTCFICDLGFSKAKTADGVLFRWWPHKSGEVLDYSDYFKEKR